MSILKGLELIHSKGFIHRDVKVENILVKNIKDSSGKVIDKVILSFIKRNTKYVTLGSASVSKRIRLALFWGPIITSVLRFIKKKNMVLKSICGL